MKKLFVLICVLAISAAAFARTNERGGQIQSCESGTQQQEPQKEKPDYRSVIVDAWLVQVSAEALYESGVKPFSEKDKENVSVTNLLWCLSDPNNGKVAVSATTRALVHEEAKNSFSNTMYWGESTESCLGNNSAPVRTRSYRPYDQKVEFRTYSEILENKQVRVNWSFFSNFFICTKTKDTSPPESRAVNYDNATIVFSQKPVIVAQTQIGNDMFFLVLRAEIVD
jgi:hypothetical protein